MHVFLHHVRVVVYLFGMRFIERGSCLIFGSGSDQGEPNQRRSIRRVWLCTRIPSAGENFRVFWLFRRMIFLWNGFGGEEMKRNVWLYLLVSFSWTWDCWIGGAVLIRMFTICPQYCWIMDKM